jgi:hypothetical protein
MRGLGAIPSRTQVLNFDPDDHYFRLEHSNTMIVAELQAIAT